MDCHSLRVSLMTTPSFGPPAILKRLELEPFALLLLVVFVWEDKHQMVRPFARCKSPNSDTPRRTVLMMKCHRGEHLWLTGLVVAVDGSHELWERRCLDGGVDEMVEGGILQNVRVETDSV
jgi:hypothetical protein